MEEPLKVIFPISSHLVDDLIGLSTNKPINEVLWSLETEAKWTLTMWIVSRDIKYMQFTWLHMQNY